MHELALSEGILEMLETRAREAGIGSIQRVVLEVGALAGVEVESLQFCFDAVTRGSLAEGAELVIVPLPAIGLCRGCRVTFPLHHQLSECPRCGAMGARLVEGTELRLREFEGESSQVAPSLLAANQKKSLSL